MSTETVDTIAAILACALGYIFRKIAKKNEAKMSTDEALQGMIKRLESISSDMEVVRKENKLLKEIIEEQTGKIRTSLSQVKSDVQEASVSQVTKKDIRKFFEENKDE